MESNHPVLTKMNQYINDLEEQASGLNRDNLRLHTFWNDRVENIRLILLDALSVEQSAHVDVNILTNSIADVLDISLLKEITVTFPITVEATMLVRADFDVDNLEIGNVDIECYNSDVEDFSVESFEIGAIDEA